MKQVLVFVIIGCLVFSGCGAPSEKAVQTAIAKTQMSLPTATMSATITPTFTLSPTVTVTNTFTPPPTVTPRPTSMPTIAPTVNMAIGSRFNPVGKNVAATITETSGSTTIKFGIVIKEIIRGDAAWVMVQKENQFNPKPSPGKQYAVIKMEIVYKEGPADKPLELDSFDFGVVSENNIVNDLIFVVSPKPEMKAKLFLGGRLEGYIVKELMASDTEGLLFYGEPGKNAVYFSLK